jgi:hypothetical protein
MKLKTYRPSGGKAYEIATDIRKALYLNSIPIHPNLCWTVDSPTFIELCREQDLDPATVRELHILGLRVVPVA